MTQGFRALGELNDSVLFWKLTHFRFIKRTIILSRAKIVNHCLKGVAFSTRFWIDDSLPSRQSFWSPGWVKRRSTDTLTSTTKELQDLLQCTAQGTPGYQTGSTCEVQLRSCGWARRGLCGRADHRTVRPSSVYCSRMPSGSQQYTKPAMFVGSS